jgi:hypothetical protein
MNCTPEVGETRSRLHVIRRGEASVELAATGARAIVEAFPRLASRFYPSLALILSQRLKATSLELAREMTLRDRRV